mgnify:CR=1 FL=1
MELYHLSATELANKIKSKEISSKELTQLYIDRIKKFDGDIRIDTHGVPLTAWEIVWNIFLIGRNDDNNPLYPNGFRYFLKYLEICIRDNTPYPEPQIRRQILKELREEN